MYYIKAVYRFLFFWVFRRTLRLKHYNNPDNVGVIEAGLKRAGDRVWFLSEMMAATNICGRPVCSTVL